MLIPRKYAQIKERITSRLEERWPGISRTPSVATSLWQNAKQLDVDLGGLRILLRASGLDGRPISLTKTQKDLLTFNPTMRGWMKILVLEGGA